MNASIAMTAVAAIAAWRESIARKRSARCASQSNL